MAEFMEDLVGAVIAAFAIFLVVLLAIYVKLG